MRGSEGEAGAASEFDLFYLGTATKIVRQLALLTGDLGEAEDVTQEAFERAWLHWSVVRACASPEAWVRTVARRLAVSRWRRMRNASAAWLRYGPPPERYLSSQVRQFDGQVFCSSGWGWLIQDCSGIFGGVGRPAKRSGCAA